MSLNAQRYKDNDFARDLERSREAKSRHHRRPRFLGGTSDERNITILPTNKHRAWHLLFRDFSPERIAQEINERFLDPDFEMVVVRTSGYKKGECQ